MIRSQLGDVLFEEGKGKDARPMLEGTLAVQKKGWGPDHPQLGDTEWRLARIALEEGRLATARALCADTLRIAHLDVPGESVTSLELDLLLAEIELAQGKSDEALPVLERLVARPLPGDDDPKPDHPRARFLLARALWADKARRARALKEAASAEEEYEVSADRGPHTARDRAELKSWLGLHRAQL